jgi:hypothetical protein
MPEHSKGRKIESHSYENDRLAVRKSFPPLLG